MTTELPPYFKYADWIRSMWAVAAKLREQAAAAKKARG